MCIVCSCMSSGGHVNGRPLPSHSRVVCPFQLRGMCFVRSCRRVRIRAIACLIVGMQLATFFSKMDGLNMLFSGRSTKRQKMKQSATSPPQAHPSTTRHGPHISPLVVVALYPLQLDGMCVVCSSRWVTMRAVACLVMEMQLTEICSQLQWHCTPCSCVGYMLCAVADILQCMQLHV